VNQVLQVNQVFFQWLPAESSKQQTYTDNMRGSSRQMTMKKKCSWESKSTIQNH